MDRVRIPKVKRSHRGSMGWYRWGGMVNLICGGCGKHAGHLGDHTISENGEVNPSLLCPLCEWHVWGILEGWGS
jgi:hypothetical protein